MCYCERSSQIKYVKTQILVLFFIKFSLENLADDKHCYKFYSVTNCFIEVDKIDHGLNVVRNLRSFKRSKLIKDNSCKLDHAKT